MNKKLKNTRTKELFDNSHLKSSPQPQQTESPSAQGQRRRRTRSRAGSHRTEHTQAATAARVPGERTNR